MGRGAFILFEGCDRSGKTTQCRKVLNELEERGIKAKKVAFPDRSTPIGNLIDEYLKKNLDIEDHAVHLLFTANRWELMSRLKKDLEEGVTLIVDRYAYSGAAFSAAKQMMDLEWCLQPEVGLIKPDVVIYLDLPTEAAAERGKYGEERYEVKAFQERVAKNYELLKTSEWKVVNAMRSAEQVYGDIRVIVQSVIAEVKNRPVEYLENTLFSKGSCHGISQLRPPQTADKYIVWKNEISVREMVNS